MERFLTVTSEKLKSGKYAKLTVVLGNESCDLDSAVSAIVYASFLYWQHEQIKNATCTRTHRDETNYTDDIFVPILNVDRDDYAIKTEVAFCLKGFSIDDSHLVFRDDIDLKTLNKDLDVILVDHHVLATRDAYLAPHVTEIIDHRPLDPCAPASPSIRCTVEVVGSCATLVTERLNALSAALGAREDYFAAWRAAAEMMHSTIILDTVNFSKEVQKGTPKDEEMVRFLEAYIDTGNIDEYRAGELRRLEAARCDVSALSARQLLRKDVKVIGDILVPSFPILVEEFLRRAGAATALAAAGARRAVLLGVKLGCGAHGVQLKTMLTTCDKPKFGLAPRPTDVACCTLYAQANIAASRKQYVPVINEFLKREAK